MKEYLVVIFRADETCNPVNVEYKYIVKYVKYFMAVFDIF